MSHIPITGLHIFFIFRGRRSYHSGPRRLGFDSSSRHAFVSGSTRNDFSHRRNPKKKHTHNRWTQLDASKTQPGLGSSQPPPPWPLPLPSVTARRCFNWQSCILRLKLHSKAIQRVVGEIQSHAGPTIIAATFATTSSLGVAEDGAKCLGQATCLTCSSFSSLQVFDPNLLPSPHCDTSVLATFCL